MTNATLELMTREGGNPLLLPRTAEKATTGINWFYGAILGWVQRLFEAEILENPEVDFEVALAKATSLVETTLRIVSRRFEQQPRIFYDLDLDPVLYPLRPTAMIVVETTNFLGERTSAFITFMVPDRRPGAGLIWEPIDQSLTRTQPMYITLPLREIVAAAVASTPDRSTTPVQLFAGGQ